MNRREVLVLLAGTGALPDKLLAVGRAVHKRARVGELRALSPRQNETVIKSSEREARSRRRRRMRQKSRAR